MPLPSALPPYDNWEDVLDLARVHLNDAIQKLGGETFTDTAVWSQTAAISGWRKFQEFMASNGSPREISTVIITGLQVAQGGNPPDPGLQASLTWTGYNDGLFQFTSPTLPNDMISPLRIWERVSGANPPNKFTPMEPITQGTTPVVQGPRNYWFEWRNDALNFPGSTNIMDVMIRYAAYLPDPQNAGDVQWYQQVVPIMRAKQALSWYVASEVSAARGDTDVAYFDTHAEAEAMKLVQREKALSAQRQQWITQSIPAATGNTNYDVALLALQMAQVRLNAVNKLGGDFLESSQEWTQQAFNSGWRKVQEVLSGLGFSTMSDEVQIPSVPVLASNDPASYTQLSWNGYDNGSGTVAPSPVLPANLVRPMRLWERVSGSNANWTPMEPNLTGLGSVAKGPRNYAWQWLGNAIRMMGSTVVMDIRIEYSLAFPDFVQTGTTPWYQVTIPISRAADCLSWYLCAEVAASVQGNADIDPNGLLTPDSFAVKGEAAAKLLVSRDQQGAQQRGEWPIPDISLPAIPQPYDYASQIMNAAKVRLDRTSTVAGDIISMGKPFCQQIFTNAYRRMQEDLANMGFLRFTDRIIIKNIPPVQTSDPAILCSLSWSGYFDGLNNNSSPALPISFMFPLECWERWSGQDARFGLMLNSIDGVMDQVKQTAFCQWEWRGDAIYFPGSQQTEDMKIRFATYLPDLVSDSTTPWYLKPVPLARCLDPLSVYICREVAVSRPDLGLDSDALEAEAKDKAKLIFNRDVRANQRTNIRRMPRSGRYGGSRMGYGMWN